MTIELIARRPMPSHPRRSDGQDPLPAPEERGRLRRAWRLSEEQVAEAFGVTAATVRSWEAGRSAPRGQRRAAYAAFLSGLAHGLVPGPSCTGTPPPAEPPAPRTPRARRTPRTPRARSGSAAAASAVSTVLRGAAPSAPGRPVGRAPDPVSPARLRRFRWTTAAVGMWIVCGHLMATTPLPHP
ncbi:MULTISPECIES: helix-turn-helix domain-containing protein [unclassified Streptomyces]|uniref:helix-turn-helix domain-containing protein n=1 Tax=unclassified Streptomyces TaxID=2593676 RepID=UPI0015EBD0E9|nr:helix-turn-helix domain-containing protein [Streptomyces sp. PsTaAH-137]